MLCTRAVGDQVTARPPGVRRFANEREVRVRVEHAGVGAGRPQRVGLDDVVAVRRVHHVQPSVAVDVIDPRVGEDRDEPRITPSLEQPVQRVELRPDDLDAGDALELGPSGEAEQRVARAEADDRRRPRMWMDERRQRAEHRVDAAVWNPALADAVGEDDDAGLAAGDGAQDGGAGAVLADVDECRRRAVELRP